jgi:Na+-transporting NADH:ubiquinone oxidoreductase subunit NqrE
MDENIFHPFSINHISPAMVFECVLKNKTLTWIIQLSFFQVMKYTYLVYDWILTISNDMENIVMMSWHFLYSID